MARDIRPMIGNLINRQGQGGCKISSL